MTPGIAATTGTEIAAEADAEADADADVAAGAEECTASWVGAPCRPTKPAKMTVAATNATTAAASAGCHHFANAFLLSSVPVRL